MNGYAQRRTVQYTGYSSKSLPSDYYELISDKIRDCYLMHKEDRIQLKYLHQDVGDWRYVLFICDDITKDKDNGHI